MGKLAKLKKKNKVRSYVAGLFDPQERLAKLSLLGDPLVELSRMIDWEAFRGDIDKARESAREHASTRARAQERRWRQADRCGVDVQGSGTAAVEQFVG